MKQIRVGTCIPGQKTFEWGPAFIQAGFECLSINFHMEYDQGDIKEYAAKVREMMEGTGVELSSIGYYCNALQFPEHKKTLELFIDNAHLFGTSLVTTFAGALEGESVEKAIPVYKEVYGDIAKRAEANGVKLAIENCPMGGDWNRATCNIGFNPKAWEMMFSEVPSKSIGLEWEPAHQMIQLIDPLPQLRQWIDRVYHVHGKDATVDLDAVRRYGVFGAHEFAPQRTPGYGDTNWRDVFFILFQNGYEGDVVVEGYHDPVFNGDWEMTSQLHAMNYLKWCRGGDFTPNPWDNK